MRRPTERVAMAAIALVFFLPLPLNLLVKNWPDRIPRLPAFNHPWLRNSTLSGVTVAAEKVPFSWSSLASGKFQSSRAAQFDERFAGREALIRVTNEIWFRLFNDTGSAASKVAVGQNGVLFEKAYLREYFIERTEKQTLAPWVKDLREVQDLCRDRGIGFVVVISPSKAALYPEDAPRAWRRWSDPRPRGYVQLAEHFRENGITFVDAPAIFAKQKAENPPALPLFPKGGVHWSSRGAWLVANDIQARFREQEKATEPLEIEQSIVSDREHGDDADLFRLMNLARSPTEPTERLTIRPSARAESERLKLTVIGASFSWELIRQFKASRQFSGIDLFFYYKLFKWREAADVSGKVRDPAVPLDFDAEVFGADCLLLEINEASSLYPEHHLSAYVKDALAHLRSRPDASSR